MSRAERAILSVSDKTGLAEFARELAALGIELFSTGGTRSFLESQGLAVRDVAAYTGFPELLEGRVKTLHPKIHGGILARRDRPDDLAALAEHGIATFDLVVVNLYPFEATVARPGVSWDEAIENIDIGGPSLIRAAAKNQAFVAVVTDASQYADVLAELRAHGQTSDALRRRLAREAFALTSAYDGAIGRYLSEQAGEREFPAQWLVRLRRREVLRYGENPHQRAALYALDGPCGASLVGAEQLAGKELSYNNLLDLDSALALARSFSEPAAVVIKHNNPCGAAVGSSLAEATERAFAGDPLSAFGSVLGFNRSLDAATAEYLSTPGLFVEAIAAPDFEPAALEILATRPKWKSNVRLMRVGPLARAASPWQFRQIEGGLLVQQPDAAPDPESEWKLATTAAPSDAQLADLRFAWEVVRHVKSNAIVVALQRMVTGVGAGQMSRVDSVEIALRKSGERVRGAVLASDAFFPFADSIEQAAAAGIAAFIQPGGSKRDDEVVAACNRHGLPMIFTGRRHFKH